MFENLFSQAGLSLDRLRSLVEIDTAGGISAAAPGDTIRQSQLSRNLSQLETFFGIELKRRVGKGIELTTAGQHLAGIAREHLRTLEGFLDSASEMPPEIRIAAGHSTLEWLVLPKLAQMKNRAGSPHLFIESLRSHQVVERLTNFSLDFGIIRKTALTSKKLISAPLTTVTFSLFCHDSLANRWKGDPVSMIRETPLALSMGGDFRRQFNEWCGTNDLSPRISYSCSSFRIVLELLKANPSIAVVLPDLVDVEKEPAGLTRVGLPGLGESKRELVLTWHERIDDIRPGAREWREEFLKAK